jgi:16S rRNA G966 N2-methylase RsmD
MWVRPPLLTSPQCPRKRIPPPTSSTKETTSVLRDYIPSNSVDLVYLDPPLNSCQDYNVLFAEKDGARSASQITAFKDTWE